MAGQGLFFRAISAVNCRFLLNNRILQIATQAQVAGLKQVDAEKLTKLDVPEKPKRPLTAYFRFVRERRQSLLKESPDLKSTDLIKKCAEDWKNVDPAVKVKFEQEFKNEVEIFAKKFTAYKESLTDDQKLALKVASLEKKATKKKRVFKKKIRENEKPKRPIGAYMLFVMDHAKTTDKTYRELLSDLKDKWRELPNTEKQKYVETAGQNKEKYDRDLRVWEEKMLKEGKEDLVRKSILVEKPRSRLEVKKEDSKE